MKRTAQGSFEFEHKPAVLSFASAVGKKESEGPLGKCFDLTFQDDLLGESTWEKAESRLLENTVSLCIEKSGMSAADFDAVFAGDLLNQCIASTFGLMSSNIPFVGMYGACSTMASTLINASAYLDGGGANMCIAATSSHFASSERQYRNPLQYGGQRTPTAQWTVTGSGAVALCRSECAKTSSKSITIERAVIGRVIDMGIKDANNMGAAMAPVSVKLTP